MNKSKKQLKKMILSLSIIVSALLTTNLIQLIINNTTSGIGFWIVVILTIASLSAVLVYWNSYINEKREQISIIFDEEISNETITEFIDLNMNLFEKVGMRESKILLDMNKDSGAPLDTVTKDLL